MKKLFGFSMTELLIVIMIIGIVSALGTTIAGKSMERAFNQYYYTGYYNLKVALDNIPRKSNRQLDTANLTANVASLFSKNPRVENGTIIAPNGINYTFNTISANKISVTMTLPTAKKSGTTSNNSVNMVYTKAERPRMDKDGNDINSLFEWVLIIEDGEAVQSRPDLIPFYIDDLKTGRVRRQYNNNGAGNGTYSTVANNSTVFNFNYDSFKNTYCSMYNSVSDVIDCTSVGEPSSETKKNSILKFKVANPRKVF